MKRISIGRMAELNCVTKKTLHIYHEKGLLTPAIVDENSGYRYYTLDQCSTIDMIQQLQVLGLTLDEIKRFQDEGNPEDLMRIANRRIAEVDKEMLQLSISRENAINVLKGYETIMVPPIRDVVIMERVHTRPIYSCPILHEGAKKLNPNAAAFLDEWELNLRMTKQRFIENDIPLALFREVGCIIPKRNLINRDFEFSKSYVSIRNQSIADAYANDIAPAGHYLTLCVDYIGPGGENMEYEGLNKVLDYAKDHGFEIVGDYFGEIIANTPAFHYSGRNMLFKIHVPIALRGITPYDTLRR